MTTAIAPAAPAVMPPAVAAARLGLPVPGLVTLIKTYRYGFTELSPGGRPGDRGRNRWGLTEDQLVAIVRGQDRTFARGAEPASGKPADSGPSPASPDGKSRLRRGRGA
jgi:hypothetical protein